MNIHRDDRSSLDPPVQFWTTTEAEVNTGGGLVVQAKSHVGEENFPHP